MNPLIIMIIVLLTLLIIGSPVVIAMASSSLIYFLIVPRMAGNFYIYVQKFFTGMDSFVLLCIPLFIFAGEIMNQSGMLVDLVNFTLVIVGRFRGGLAYMNVLVSMMFGGVSGSGLADVASLGPIEIEMMKKGGYTAPFAAALTATSAIQGPIIPPSIPAVIFASATGISVGALFLAGVIPGVLIGIGQMIVIFFSSKKRNFPKTSIKFSFKESVKLFMSAFFALLMPLIIIGGIVGGYFTPTEAAAVASFYALIIYILVYRKFNLKDFKRVLFNTAKVTSSIYLILGFVGIVAWILAIEKVPLILSNFALNSGLSTNTLLLLVNLFFLFNGMWISDTPQILLFGPVFCGIFNQLGVHPVHFGMIMIVNVMIGMITPPYGLALYLASSVSKTNLRDIVIETLPFTIVSLIVLLLVTYIPSISLFLPKLFGLI